MCIDNSFLFVCQGVQYSKLNTEVLITVVVVMLGTERVMVMALSLTSLILYALA